MTSIDMELMQAYYDTLRLDEEVISEGVKQPPILYILNELIQYCNNYNPEDRKKAHRLFQRFLNNFTSPNTFEIIGLFKEYAFLTQTEVVYLTKLSSSSILNSFRSLLDSGIIEHVGYVEKPFRNMTGGRRPKLYGILGANPERARESQERFRKIRLGQTLTNNENNLSGKKLKQLESQRIGELVHQVAECIPNPLEKLGDLYDCMNLLGISDEDRVSVREGVMKQIGI